MKALIFPFVILSTACFSTPPHDPNLVDGGNRWVLESYDDDLPDHRFRVVHSLCFFYEGTFGTHQRYKWFALTYPSWQGRCTQEGDHIQCHGNWAPLGNNQTAWLGNDAMTFMLYSFNEASGHWWEWRDGDSGLGFTLAWLNAKLIRSGRCDDGTPEDYDFPHTRNPTDRL